MLSSRRGFIAACALGSTIACTKEDAIPKNNSTVTGTGATLPAPLYEKWFAEYGPLSGTRIVYQATGSSKGVQAILTDTANFGASDVPMSQDELSQAGGDVLQIPTTLSAVAIVYNLPDVSSLKLTGEVLAEIVSGEIKSWSHPKIAQLNSGVTLPDLPLLVVRRTDGSGTTTALTEYLAQMSPSFKEKYGVGPRIKAPGALEANGNSGVAIRVAQVPGSLSYVALNYARAHNLQMASMFNSSGAYVAPSLDSLTAAASQPHEDLTRSLINSRAPGAYPIASFSYILVHQDAEQCEARSALAQFLWWALHEGQSFAPFLNYAALPPAVVKKAEEHVRKMTCRGQPVL